MPRRHAGEIIVINIMPPHLVSEGAMSLSRGLWRASDLRVGRCRRARRPGDGASDGRIHVAHACPRRPRSLRATDLEVQHLSRRLRARQIICLLREKQYSFAMLDLCAEEAKLHMFTLLLIVHPFDFFFIQHFDLCHLKNVAHYYRHPVWYTLHTTKLSTKKV